MTPRPTAAANLLAQIAKTVPARLAKKLDAGPTVANGWTWESSTDAWTVRTDGDAVVSLTAHNGVIGERAQVTCTCLLAPRCFHILAVVAVLDADESVAPPAQAVPDAPLAPVENGDSVVALLAEQIAAARAVWMATRDVVAVGASGAGAVVQGELLRAIHEARAVGLHRVAAAGLGVVRRIRELREARPEFSANALVDALAEVLSSSQVVAAAMNAKVSATWVGVARRSYEDLGGMRVFGIAAEPIVAASSYAGVVTYCADDRGLVWTVSDVAPGGAGRARAAYDATVALGDVGLRHRDFVRAGLFVQGATGSHDGRLGAGRSVQAVRAAGAGWLESPIASRFAAPFAEQIARALAALDLPVETRRAGDALLFLRLSVVGLEGAGIIARVASEDREVLLGTALDHEELPLRDNLRRLGRAGQLGLLAIARVPERGDRLELIAVANEGSREDGPRLALPNGWGGVCNVGFDALQGAHVIGGAMREDGVASASRPDPLGALARSVVRVALFGRSAIPPSSYAVLTRDARALEGRMMPTGAALLDIVADAAADKQNPDALAAAWTSCAAYERAARRSLAWS